MEYKFGLKVRAVLSFHQHGTGPDNTNWIPLPLRVFDEMQKNLELTYCDMVGRRNIEYISLGCDILPVLCGHSPIQTVRRFYEGVQIGMGPGGELRFPSFSSQEPNLAWSMNLESFSAMISICLLLCASAINIGKPEWGNGGPFVTGRLMQNPERTDFLENDAGSWDTPYGKFFLKWYSDMSLLHGERICREAETIFRGTGSI